MKIVSKIRLLFLGSAGIFLPLLAEAQSANTTLDFVISRALSESPLVREITARIASKRAVGIEAKSLANPTLDAELRTPVSNTKASASEEVAVALSQPFRLSDFGARDRVNALIQQAADVDQRLELLGLSQRIKLAFAKTWALSSRASEIRKYLARAKKIENDVNRAAESGYIAPGERAIFKAEVIKARYQLAAVLADLERARAELSKSAGFTVPESLARPTLGELPQTDELLQNGAGIPARARALLAVKLAREQLKLAELDSYPKFAPRLVYERTNDETDYVGLGLAIELPIFNRNQASRGVQAAELAAAQSLDRYLSSEDFASEVQALRSKLEASIALLAGYEKELLPTLREAVLAEEQLLNSGQGSMFRVWQTLRELSLTEAEIVERTIGVFSDQSELAILTGIDF